MAAGNQRPAPPKRRPPRPPAPKRAPPCPPIPSAASTQICFPLIDVADDQVWRYTGNDVSRAFSFTKDLDLATRESAEMVSSFCVDTYSPRRRESNLEEGDVHVPDSSHGTGRDATDRIVYSSLNSGLLEATLNNIKPSTPCPDLTAFPNIVSGYLDIRRSGRVKKMLPFKRRWCILNPWLRCVFYWKKKEDRKRPDCVAKCIEGIRSFRVIPKTRKLVLEFGSRRWDKVIRPVSCDLDWKKVLEYISSSSKISNFDALTTLTGIHSVTVSASSSSSSSDENSPDSDMKNRTLTINDIRLDVQPEGQRPTLVRRKVVRKIQSVFKEEYMKSSYALRAPCKRNSSIWVSSRD